MKEPLFIVNDGLVILNFNHPIAGSINYQYCKYRHEHYNNKMCDIDWTYNIDTKVFFSDFIEAIRRCKPDIIKEVLKQYPDFLEHFL